MGRLPDSELVRLVTSSRAFADPETAIAVILGESGGDPSAVNRQPDNIDRGLWQISSKWHPNFPDAAAFDPEASTAYAFTLSAGGTDFNPWHATRGPNFPTHRAEAQRILSTSTSSGGGSWAGTSAQGDPNNVGAVGVGIEGVGSVGLDDLAGGALDAVTGLIPGVAGAREVLGFLGKGLSLLVSADFWKRVGYALAGVVLLWLGFGAIFGRQAAGLGITAASRGTVNGSELVADDLDGSK